MSLVPSSSGQEIPPQLLLRFLALISGRTGLQIREKDRRDLQRTLSDRMVALKIGRSEAYLQLLEAQNALNQGEWARLLPRLTNGESYFWRDKGQFSLLRTRLLPELIEARAASRSLRIWSAGCSTGEEPYSLAMLVDELLPNREGWNISILGTDINPLAIDKARAGVYGAWAFRGLDIAVQEKYFERNKGEFQISPRLQSMVTFGLCNLRGDEFPSRVSGIYDMDLILCRNVLIYFSGEAIAHAINGFARTLRDGGYLLTGHAELANHSPAPLIPRAFAESVAYLKCSSPAPRLENRPRIELPLPGQKEVSSSPAQAPAPAPQTQRPSLISLPPIQDVFDQTAVKPAIAMVTEGLGTGSGKTDSKVVTLCRDAREFADLGRHDDAIRACREAIALDSTCDDAYFVWAQVESELGKREEAKNLFKKVIYLAPTRFDAHLEMSALYETENDPGRARRERQAALDLLRQMPPGEMLASHPGVTAGELRLYLEEGLQEAGQVGAINSRNRGLR